MSDPDARSYWDSKSMFLAHALTPVEHEEWQERSAIIQEATSCERWVADLEAGKICKEYWIRLARET